MIVTAAVIVIGNEILSGRTQDRNINFIALELVALGIKLQEIRVIPDIHETIVEVVRELSAKYNYIFTTGGIGPTHDDITTEAVAAAFNVSLYRHPEAVKSLADYYGADGLTAARLKMADVPDGAELIPNSVSSAPGYKKENVYVMAGIPKIMQEMFLSAKKYLKGGNVTKSEEVSAYVSESKIAGDLSLIQDRFSNVEIGSYPFSENGKYGVSIVLRSDDEKSLAKAKEEVILMFASITS